MLLVVESGSTKADWRLVGNNIARTFETKGFNPLFFDEPAILNELNSNNGLSAIKAEVTELYFYGAGCSTHELCAIVKSGLSIYFTNAKIEVNSDLKASAYASYSGSPQIVCILGTGSNSCAFDGSEFYQAVPSLGYVLGDEGSGNYFGKRLLADFLYQRLPAELSDELGALGLTKTNIIDNVYRQPAPNRYIASFMTVLIKHKKLPYCQNLIKKGLQEFIDVFVKSYTDYKSLEVNFVGSVAFYLKEELETLCNEEGIGLGKVIQKPLEHLVRFHLNKK